MKKVTSTPHHVKRIGIFLALILCVSTILSCGGGEKAVDTTASGNDSTFASDVTLSPEESRRQIDDEIPVADFGGEKFIIGTNSFCENEFVAEEATGDVLNDALYKRTVTVEERFNVDIVMTNEVYGDMTSNLTSLVNAGDDYYQLVAHDRNGQSRFLTAFPCGLHR